MNAVRFGFAKFRLANFEFTCNGTDRCSLGPPVAGAGDGVKGNAEGSRRAELPFSRQIRRVFTKCQPLRSKTGL
jgi:hypothetical protein